MEPTNPFINDGKYENKLRHELWAVKFDRQYEPGLINLFLALLNLDLQKINVKDLTAYFKSEGIDRIKKTSIKDITDNKELIAKWYEVLFVFDRKLIRDNLKDISFKYRDLYEATSNMKYLVRHLALIRQGKQLFKEELSDIYSFAKPITFSSTSAYWRHQLLPEIASVFSAEKCQSEFSLQLEQQVASYLNTYDFTSARFAIQSLGAIGSINPNECRIRLAESYEVQADHYVATKEPNTYYPAISQNYQEGLAQIIKVAGCAELKKRLESKLQEAQLDDYQMVRAAGADLLLGVDFQKLQQNILGLNIDSFETAYQTLLALSFTPNAVIEQMVAKEKKSQSLTAKLFSGQVKINTKGAQVGFADGDAAMANTYRGYYRETNIAYVQLLKDVMDLHQKVSKEAVYALVEKTQSPFIPKDRIFIFAQGLYDGFNNEFISSAHLLLPQMENSLRYMATQAGMVMTNYDKKEQHENILGGTLQKIEGIIDADLLAELKSFLNDTSSVNFRNELAHGLMNSVLIHHYGKYLWWLFLKLVFQTSNYFKLEKPVTA